MRFVRPDLHVLAGAYSVDAIDDDSERARFEHHLRRCQQCSDEVRGMAATTTRLGFATSAAAPPQMRDHVLAAVSRTRQLPPLVDHGSVPSEPRPRRMPRSAWVAVAASLAVIVVLTTMLVRTQASSTRPRLETPRWPPCLPPPTPALSPRRPQRAAARPLSTRWPDTRWSSRRLSCRHRHMARSTSCGCSGRRACGRLACCPPPLVAIRLPCSSPAWSAVTSSA